ncbi:MAG: 4-hydroxy-tetrahydrodipicolinate reductase [Methanomicrobiales archaeon]|nr:4-hydroxy-tetrahydrodipicolinate reductase [Methanomicrobiales archaeon]
MIKVVVCGALGRMGGTIGKVFSESSTCRIVGGIDLREGTYFGTKVVPASEIETLLKDTEPDVLVDFTMPAAAVQNVKTGAKHGAALVVGTTGFTPAQREEMRKSIQGRVPAVISSNFSVGVNIFWSLIGEAAARLKGYDIEVIEAHHRFKKDAPSGTAKTIVERIKRETGDRREIFGREGMTERGDEIGIHVIRGGDIVGEHSVLFAGNFECIELSHRAYDRAVFARGALRATEWITGKPPGIYTMEDVLGLPKK